jgi:hypothetical protein
MCERNRQAVEEVQGRDYKKNVREAEQKSDPNPRPLFVNCPDPPTKTTLDLNWARPEV